MRALNKAKQMWPFSIRFYAFSFIIFMSLVFGLIGWSIQYKLNTIRTEATSRNTVEALTELGHTINHIYYETKTRADSIARQDETKQQFYNADYYHYWRDNRILNGSAQADYVTAVELYTSKGKSLTEKTLSGMPKLVSKLDLNNFITHENGRNFIYLFFPVLADDADSGSLQGYISFKLDLLKALHNEQRFSYIDIDTLDLKIKEGIDIPYDQALINAAFSLIPNTENLELAASVEKFQRQMLFSMIVLYFLFYIMLSSVLSAPLRRLSIHIDELRKGRGGLLTKQYTRSLPIAELEKVRISLNDYQTKLEEMHLSLNQKNDELWQLAHHDPLTGIYNRRGFEEDWKHMLSVSSGHRLGVGMILFDCDHFKAINDTYGHPTGDQLLQAITHTLQDTLRHGDRLYRIGGDEFATLFLDIDLPLALQTAERCIEAISQYDFTTMGIKEPVRVSAGMAYATGTDIESLNNLPKQADVAMYHAKRPGKIKIAVFDPSMTEDTDVIFSNSVNNLVFKVMESDELLEMHYQPISNLETGKTDYYEALMRIRDGENLVMPSTIFPIITERRLEAEFDAVILAKVAKDLAQGKIPAGTGISFNVSGPGLIHPSVQDKINELATYLPQYKLIVEITETALITQLHVATTILNKLREKGFLIALDDFGSGYSSLSYLSNMPVDCVKFDISLIRQLLEGGRQSVIIENLATMVIKAGYELIAEGVETNEIFEKIKELGFMRGQGYLFGRPESVP